MARYYYKKKKKKFVPKDLASLKELKAKLEEQGAEVTLK